MLRPSLLLLGCVAAALSVAAPAAAAPTEPSEGPAVETLFEPAAEHGFYALVEASAEEVTLSLTRKGRTAIYAVMGEVSETGLKAEFGRLGLIDVAFEPTATRKTR